MAVLCMLYEIRCNRYTHVMMLYFCRMCQCWSHKVLRLQISILMLVLAAEPRSIAKLLFCYYGLCGTNLPTLCSMVWDWRVLRAGPMIFLLPYAARSRFVFSCFPFLFFQWVGIVGRGALVFGPLVCQSHSHY